LPTTTTTYKDSDIKFYYSGGNNLGGTVNLEASELSESFHGLFNIVSSTERTLGKTKYRCIYMKNTSLLTAKNPKIFIPQNTPSSGTELYFAWDPHGVGDGLTSGVADSIPDESTAPYSGSLVFSNGNEVSKGAALGADLPPGKVAALWLRLIINVNTEKSELDGTEIFIQLSNERDVEGTVETPVDTDVAVVGETDSNEWFQKLMERLRLGTLNWLVFTGNVSSSTDPRSWFNMLGVFRDRTALSFGSLDSIIPQTKNTLTTLLGNNVPGITTGYYFKKRYNLYEIFMDVTKPFENPSPQYDFIVANLNSAKNDPKIDFIVVYCNKAFYATLAANDAAQVIDGRLRATYHKLFEDNGVHVVISGQFRNYQRQKVLSWNESAPDVPGEYTTGQPNFVISTGQKSFGPGIGCLFINCGLGGKRPIHTLATPKSYTAYSYSPTNELNIGWIRYKSEPKRVNIVTGDVISNPKLTIKFYEYNMPTFFQSIFGQTAQEIQKDQVSIEIQGSS
jgi:acylphosphatase